jgi:membrane peptidoglycan carboxypeptidase
MVRDRQEYPETRWADVLERSADARKATGEWIYRSRFKEAQNLRIRIELERRAFVEIHKAWKELGYPFDSLVPSLATAIGSSADRPQSLAELVGIIQRGGVRVPLLRVESLHFGVGTPYETHFEPAQGPGDRVMPREVAVALKGLMQDVVQGGTARRVASALTDVNGQPIPIGGKTGSGDNRYEKVASNGAVISSRAINRTASFVFVIGDRFFGMVSAYVEGEEAGKFSFTSSLALQAFRSIAPAVEPLVRKGELAARAAAPAPRVDPVAMTRVAPARPRPAVPAVAVPAAEVASSVPTAPTSPATPGPTGAPAASAGITVAARP